MSGKTLLTLMCALGVSLLAGCAIAPPIDLAGADMSVTPARAAADIGRVHGRRVAWGGMIINTRNLEKTTEIEVLGYPLDESGEPDTGSAAQHRFLIVHSGYLESADYRRGRLVSAVGSITATRHGKVGEAPYVYPVLQADELYLWPPGTGVRRGPNVHFGVGVGVIFH